MSRNTSGLAGLLPKTNCKFSWRDVELTETIWSSKNYYDLSADLSFEKALAVLSEGTSFCEKIKIAEEGLALNPGSFDEVLFFKESNYMRYDLIKQIQILIKNLPANFLNWCSVKKLNLKDFRAFLNDYVKDYDSLFFLKISELDPTKSTGLQIIELYYDLRAQDKLSFDDISSFKNSDLLLISLQKKRFSQTLSKDQMILEELSKIKIARGVKATLKRNGDKRQIKLEIEADSPEQLQLKLEKALKNNQSFKEAWYKGAPS